MKRASEFQEQKDELQIQVQEAIEALALKLRSTEFEPDTIYALIMVEDFESSHVEVVDIVRISEEGVLFGQWGDEPEEELDFELMTIDTMLALLEDLEQYDNL